jgi:lipid II isoglutaminyl synthase (glutamine-hydrolysing)
VTAPEGGADRTIRVVHVFPDLLSTYGDSGNIRTLVMRAERRGIQVTVARVHADDARVPVGDVFVIGGGQDRDQLAVEAALRRLGAGLERQIGDGAALLAICGGYQNLGRRYRFANGRTVHGPGIFPVETKARGSRLVGPVVTRLAPDVARRIGGGSMPSRTTVIGFENHSGRTFLDALADAFATVEIGSGNNGEDGTEGLLAASGAAGIDRLRIGSYLHGPLLPRNPHVADALIRAGLARTGQPLDLEPLDDRAEWRAHDRFLEQVRRREWVSYLPHGLQRVIAPARGTAEP